MTFFPFCPEKLKGDAECSPNRAEEGSARKMLLNHGEKEETEEKMAKKSGLKRSPVFRSFFFAASRLRGQSPDSGSAADWRSSGSVFLTRSSLSTFRTTSFPICVFVITQIYGLSAIFRQMWRVVCLLWRGLSSGGAGKNARGRAWSPDLLSISCEKRNVEPEFHWRKRTEFFERILLTTKTPSHKAGGFKNPSSL